MAHLESLSIARPAQDGDHHAIEETSPAVNSILGANPFVGIDGNDFVRTLTELAGELVSRPASLLSAALKLSGAVIRIAAGTSDIEPESGDRRFTDPAWEENLFYRGLMQAYLAWRKTTQDLVEADGPAHENWKASGQHRFAITLLTEALAPTNFLWGNPAALKRCFETGGRSLLNGFRNFLDDLWNNGGMPSQVDKRPFKVGETIAVTPGAVIYRGDLCEIIQYSPATPQVRSRPVLLAPPQINKYYVMDMAPKRSLIEYAVAHGYQLFAISWRNPGPEYRNRGLDDYVTAIKDAIAVVTEITQSPDANLLAVCAGGITSTLLLGHLAAIGDKRIHSGTLLVTMLDSGEASMTGMFTTEENVRAACLRSSQSGVLDAASLGRTFAWLRPNDLVWHYWVNNYLMGKSPEPFDILYWNADSTNLPARLHAGFLDLLLHNPLLGSGQIEVLGTPVDLRAVENDMFLVAGMTDHICSWRAVYHAAQLFGGRTEFVLNSSGHVQSLVCPPNNFKAKYFTNPRLEATPEQWLASATEHKGTWWDHWLEWLERRSGELRPAPEAMGSGKLPPLCPAPGTYVHQRP